MQAKSAPTAAAFAILSVPLLATCSQPAPSEPGAVLDLSPFEIVDLSHAYDGQTLFWPTSTDRFELTELSYGVGDDGYFYSANAFSTPEHGGTHMDAPIHFSEAGLTLDRIPVSRLVAPAVIIDISAAAEADSDYRLTRQDVEAWEQENGPIPERAAVLLRTGWDRYWPDALAYLGDDTPGDATHLHFPSYGEEAVRFLIDERAVGLLGVDTASIDYGPSSDFIVHQIANGAGVPALENVAHLDRLPTTGAWIVALPIKIAGGSGGPVRIIALLP